jgi:hypothetical protein
LQNDVAKQPQELIDLNELDEEQLKQLQTDEKQQQQKFFNIDHLNRLYFQIQFLYKIRGKKLENVSNRFTAYKEDMSREIREMKHRLYSAEKNKQSFQTSLDQAHALCSKYKSEMELAVKNLAKMQEKAEDMKQKLNTLERVQEQNEYFIQQLRDQYEKDMIQLRESSGEAKNLLKDKHDEIRLLNIQLETAGQNAERAAVERADIINRLTKNFKELKDKSDNDSHLAGININK